MKLAALLLLMACCHPAPIAATQATQDLCRRLTVLGCSSGSDPSCPLVLAKLEADSLTSSACLLAAQDKTAVQACGPAVLCP